MTVNIDNNFIAMWYFQPEEKMDFMGGLSAKGEPSPQPVYPTRKDQKMEMEFVYRFRYYKDEIVDSFLSKDEKHWYSVVISDNTPDEAISKLRSLINALAKGFEKKVTELVIDEEGVMGMMKRMQKLPFMHVQEVKAGES